MAMVLGPIMESSLRQSLLMSHGSFGIFFIRPISAILLVLGFAFLIIFILSKLRKKTDKE